MALSNITAQMKIDELASNVEFTALSSAQKLQVLNTVSQEIANYYNAKERSDYKDSNIDTEFGNPFDPDYTQLATSAIGAVCSIDLSLLNIDNIYGCQVKDGGSPTNNVLSDFITPVDINAIFAYVNDADCPDVAMAVNGKKVYVFIKQSFAQHDAAYFCAVFFYKKVTGVVATGDMLDIPPEASNLCTLLCIKQSQILAGLNPAREITQQINSELTKLELN